MAYGSRAIARALESLSVNAVISSYSAKGGHGSMSCEELGNDASRHNDNFSNAQQNYNDCISGKQVCTSAQIAEFKQDMEDANAAVMDVYKQACALKCDFTNEQTCKKGGFSWG